MTDISVGAVGAAIVAGLVSLLGLIIGKEQKVSEFRQAWIEDLRKCFISYLVNLNSIADKLRLQKVNGQTENVTMLENYKLLNEASHGIIFRINTEEATAKLLLRSMESFEAIAEKNSSITSENIKTIEEEFIKYSKKLLKFEWDRVKRGEMIFVWIKRVLAIFVLAMIVLFAFIINNKIKPVEKKVMPPYVTRVI